MQWNPILMSKELFMRQREMEIADKDKGRMPIEYYINEHKFKPKATITTTKTKNNEQDSIK